MESKKLVAPFSRRLPPVGSVVRLLECSRLPLLPLEFSPDYQWNLNNPKFCSQELIRIFNGSLRLMLALYFIARGIQNYLHASSLQITNLHLIRPGLLKQHYSKVVLGNSLYNHCKFGFCMVLLQLRSKSHSFSSSLDSRSTPLPSLILPYQPLWFMRYPCGSR